MGLKGMLFVIFALLVAPSACANERTFQVAGPINARFIASLSRQIEQSSREGESGILIISDSPGGDVDSLERLLNITRSNIDKIFVAGQCLSACAEFLAFSGLPVQLGKRAYVGYHIGPVLASQLAHKYVKNMDFTCLDRIKSRFLRLPKKRNWNPLDAAHEVDKRIMYYAAKSQPWSGAPECTSISAISRHKYWFPSVIQLNTVFGINAVSKTSPACNEVASCIFDQVSRYWIGKQSIVVEDKTVESPNQALPRGSDVSRPS